MDVQPAQGDDVLAVIRVPHFRQRRQHLVLGHLQLSFVHGSRLPSVDWIYWHPGGPSRVASPAKLPYNPAYS